MGAQKVSATSSEIAVGARVSHGIIFSSGLRASEISSHSYTQSLRYQLRHHSVQVIEIMPPWGVICSPTHPLQVYRPDLRQISFFVRGLKTGGPVDSSNLVNERVNYDEVTSVDLGSTPQGFQICASTDRLQVRFLVQEDWRARDAVDALEGQIDLCD